MPTTIYRATSTGTVPASADLAGTVTTSAYDTKALLYTGSNDIGSLVNDGNSGVNGFVWLYVPNGTPKISKILGIYQVSDLNWAIRLDVGIGSLTSEACKLCTANLVGWSITNDGGTTGTVATGGDAATNLLDGESISNPQLGPSENRAVTQTPLVINATSTSFLITENS